uniref:39S ribosomal protein L32, mitochondrial-like n=1 Tax=Jaculus jaculus TaxID=51337 RepID=UPI001E1B4611|nr:39S ribosomal protein L32, mitochondrial-like [Jaculus jaculus]
MGETQSSQDTHKTIYQDRPEAQQNASLKLPGELLRRKLQQSWAGFSSPPCGPALAIQGTPIFTELANDTTGDDSSSLLDNVFWMAAPKNRRTIEVNRCRRRNSQKLVKVKNNIDVCPQCGHLKQKHVLCGYCYEKVQQETKEVRKQIWKQEGGPFKAPPLETVVLYTGETPSEQDQGKRIVERDRKRPSWFTQN